MKWPIPWISINEFGPRAAAMFEARLQQVLVPPHPLHGLSLSSLARRYGTDDVLYQLRDGSSRVVLVHLALGRHVEATLHPACQFFTDLDSWRFEWSRSDPELK